MAIQGNFIFGDPAEDLETMMETMGFSKQYKKILLGYGLIIPYPGTTLYENLISDHVITNKQEFYRAPRNYNMTKLDDIDYLYLIGKVSLESSRRRGYVLANVTSVVKSNKLYEIKVVCSNCKTENHLYLQLYNYDIGCVCKECFSRMIMETSNKKFGLPILLKDIVNKFMRRFFQPIIFSRPYVFRVAYTVLYPIYQYMKRKYDVHI